MRHAIVVWAGAALAAVAGPACTSSLPSESPGPAELASVPVPAAGAGRLLGSGGCAARGCHGGPTVNPATGEPEARWSNAYTLWMRFDRHAQAYRVLQDDPAKAMIDRLRAGQPDASWRDAHVEPRCLACHVTPELARVNEPHLWAEGVNCDACHTMPGRTTTEWLVPHQLARSMKWPEDRYAAHGMRLLDAPARRAEVCVGCHIGAPAADGIPVREVTHDLVAAGHPRLDFEFVTYLALMPPHWAERSPGPGLPAEAWFAGQVEAAKAGLALHADRCDRVGQGGGVVWPELAEWNCYACHHDLATSTGDWRGQRVDARTPRSPGQPLWTGGNITDPLRQVLRGNPDLLSTHDRLQQEAVRGGRTGASGAIARDLHLKLEQTRANPPFSTADLSAGQSLVERLRLPERLGSGELARLGWDDAAHTYYALRAANRCNRPTQRPPDDADRVLDRIADQLRLPRDPVYNSPWQYDPTKLAPAWVEFADAFNRRGR